MLCYDNHYFDAVVPFPPSSVKSRSPTSKGLTQPGYHLGHLSLGYWSFAFASVNTFQTACKYSSKQHVAPSASLYYTVVWWPITWRDHSEPANDWFGQLLIWFSTSKYRPKICGLGLMIVTWTTEVAFDETNYVYLHVISFELEQGSVSEHHHHHYDQADHHS